MVSELKRMIDQVSREKGEKIDIVTWDNDPAKFICNALSPAEVERVIVDEDRQAMEVVVPDDQLSLAIGKKGQNVRLASRISGWNLDIISESNYNRVLREAYDSFLSLDGVGEKTASNLYQMGFRSMEDLAGSSASDLVQVEGIGDEKAEKLIENVAQYFKDKESLKDKEIDEEPAEEKKEEELKES